MTGHDDGESLSPEGRLRRDAMLADMLRLVDATRARRRRRRQAASAAAMLLLAIVLFRVGRFTEPVDQPAGDRNAGRGGPVHATTIGAVQRVEDSGLRLTEWMRDDATSVERLQTDAPRRIVWLDDEGLVAELASINRPAGLVRQGGQASLTAAVTDEELGMLR